MFKVKLQMSGRSFALILFCLLKLPFTTNAQQSITAQVVVYGATSAGITAAIAAANGGASVIVIEPGYHLGGMLTGGLSHTDYGDRSVIGGLALDFYKKVAVAYNTEVYFWRGPEPHIGELILKNWLKSYKVVTLFGERLQSVHKRGSQIVQIQTTQGTVINGEVFIDATYEGDLMAKAGVSYAIGRESTSQYSEKWAGRQPFRPDRHNFPIPVSPFKDGTDDQLLPLINPIPMVPVGAADNGVQAYCFRLSMTKDPENKAPILKPDDYDSLRYDLLRRYIISRKPQNLRESGVFNPLVNLPHGKAEINSLGPISTNLYDGSNWAYPDATYQKRDAIWKDHLSYTKGLLYFISHDPVVPKQIRDEASNWGLCKDEFTDTEHYPHQLYVREARRMIGEYILKESDLLTDTHKYDAVGMGAYNIDVRNVQRNWEFISRFPGLSPEVYNEGYLSIPVLPYQIPYRSLVPQYKECTNLIVPVCISSSHLGYASFRMEPQYMIAGHAAGDAAVLAVNAHIPVQQVPIPQLQAMLKKEHQVIDLDTNPNGYFQQGDTLIIDDDFTRSIKKTGNWSSSEDPSVKRHEITYLYAKPEIPSTISFIPKLKNGGYYKIYGWWPMINSAGDKVSAQVVTADGVVNLSLNQKKQGDSWVLLGTFRMDTSGTCKVTLGTEGAGGLVVADAFKFEYLKK